MVVLIIPLWIFKSVHIMKHPRFRGEEVMTMEFLEKMNLCEKAG